MTTSKLIDNNRRVHAAKVLAQASKKNQTHNEPSQTAPVDEKDNSALASLNKQYEVIREDILKLREDLADGYDLLKDYLESKVNLRTLIRVK